MSNNVKPLQCTFIDRGADQVEFNINFDYVTVGGREIKTAVSFETLSKTVSASIFFPKTKTKYFSMIISSQPLMPLLEKQVTKIVFNANRLQVSKHIQKDLFGKPPVDSWTGLKHSNLAAYLDAAGLTKAHIDSSVALMRLFEAQKHLDVMAKMGLVLEPAPALE